LPLQLQRFGSPKKDPKSLPPYTFQEFKMRLNAFAAGALPGPRQRAYSAPHTLYQDLRVGEERAE